ncbi:MAG: c-type cytochrome [Gammaproteobacteria bacterium]|nr:c-type cytochrome [Gammaproteobacteria bacterium]
MLVNRILLIIILIVAATTGVVISYRLHPQDNSPPPPPANIEPERTFHYPMQFIQSLKDNPNPGKAIFHEYCASCHSKDPEIPVGAPAIGDAKAWEPFHKMSLDNLLKLASSGYGAMPARGGCFECNDHYLKLAIQYMLSNSQPRLKSK